MDSDKIKKLLSQISAMEPSQINLKEAICALCDHVLQLFNQVNTMQRELDDYGNYRMEQNERR